jgi:hypothetical protein
VTIVQPKKKTLLSCSITNRESTAIRGCRLHVKDAEGVEWSVEGDRVIAPLETATIEWSSFTAHEYTGEQVVGRAHPFEGRVARA